MTTLTEPQKQKARIALAEACGAKWLCHHGYRYLSFGPVRFPDHYCPKDFAKGDESIANEYFSGWDIPNYPESLDACAQVEAMLTHAQCIVYHEKLKMIQSLDTQEREGETEYPAQDFWFHATAQQRTLALLQVLAPEWDK